MCVAHVKRRPSHQSAIQAAAENPEFGQMLIYTIHKSHYVTTSLSSDGPFTFGKESPFLNSGTVSKTYYLPPLSNSNHSPCSHCSHLIKYCLFQCVQWKVSAQSSEIVFCRWYVCSCAIVTLSKLEMDASSQCRPGLTFTAVCAQQKVKASY